MEKQNRYFKRVKTSDGYVRPWYGQCYEEISKEEYDKVTQKLEDLFKSFTNMTVDEQFAKVKEVRDTRSIERPAVAQRRRKKEHKTSEKKKDNIKQMLLNLSPEERALLIKKLGG